MELIDDSAEDIFSPTNSNSLNGLFGQSNTNADLKYQPPKKPSEETPKEPQPPKENVKKSESFIVHAFAWDGQAYKPVGKVGVAIVAQEEKALMVLYKSKQQTLSTLDLSQEHLKVEQQSENVLGTLDMQGRAWSLRFEDSKTYMEFLREMLSKRLPWLSKSWLIFPLSKSTSPNTISKSFFVTLKIENDEVEIQIDCQQDWHQAIIGYHEGSSFLIYGDNKSLKDLSCVTEDMSFMKATILKVTQEKLTQNPALYPSPPPSGMTKAEEGKNTQKYLTKVGKAVIPMSTQKERKVESEVPDEKSVENVTEKSVEMSEISSTKYFEKSTSGDLINMIITENRLQNTELRMTVMKMNDKLDSLLMMEQRSKNSNPIPAAARNLDDEHIKKAMNKMFKQLKSVIDPNETYTGQEVVKLVATCVKSSME